MRRDWARTGKARLFEAASDRAQGGWVRMGIAIVAVLGVELGVGVAAAEAAAAEAGWELGFGWRSRALASAGAGDAGFRALDSGTTGISFAQRTSDVEAAANRVLENGGGVAAGDFDGDGRCDLFFCGLAGNSTLYRNLGEWRFADVTGSAGLKLATEGARGAVFADLNGDGRPDLLVSTLARGVLCFLNEGGTFRDASEEAGTLGFSGSTTLALADVDGNGTPDLYVTRYRADDIRDSSLVEVRRVRGRPELHPKYAGRLVLGPTGLIEFGEPDVLLLNDGRARFRPLSWTEGAFVDEAGQRLVDAPRDWGLSATFRDVNRDGAPDLYVCNDYATPDRFWINTGNGTFRAAPMSALRHTSENSMGVDFADLDRDGHLDFLVLDMLDPDPRVRRRQAMAQTRVEAVPGEIENRPQIMRNTLFRGRGDGSYAEIAEFAGLGRSGWSWQPLFVDVDLDGWDDVLMPSGHRRDIQDLDATEKIGRLQHAWTAYPNPRARQEAFVRELVEHGRMYPGLASPIRAYRNRGGFRFEDVTATWGLDVAAVHQGSALADLDGDGDLDLVVNALGGPAGVYRNTGSAARVAVRLRGGGNNTEGVGAVVRWMAGAAAEQSREVVAGGRYLSGSDMLVVFGTGGAPREGTLEVTWRDGRFSKVEGVRANRLYEIEATSASPPTRPPSDPVAAPWFEDRSSRLGHRHHENPPRDLELQPLLYRRVSQGGPGLALADIESDGWFDVIVGSGSGGRMAAFTNDHRGGWTAANASVFEAEAVGDVTGLVSFRDADGRVRVLSGRDGESGAAGGTPTLFESLVSSIGPGSPVGGRAVPTGPLAIGDRDGDGMPDLFVGGGPIAGRYPEAAPSEIYRRDGGAWRRDEVASRVVAGVGLANGAVWGDLDEDGDGDLIVACEWGPIRVFRSDRERLVEVTRDWGMAEHTGWWQGVTLGDLDGDGRLDVVAGNWGSNGGYRATPERPHVLVYGDFLGREAVDLLEGEWDVARGVLAPRRRLDELASAMPPIRTLFPTHARFVEKSLDEVVRAFGREPSRLEVRSLASTVFYNRGGRFEAEALPAEAQYAPVFGLAVADFDGDGHQDVFLAQNCFALPWHEPRLDAGRGLLLRGFGDGRLVPLPAAESGIRIDGEQRGVVVGDLDRDGRVDLVVGQNGAETRWNRNRTAIPGIRVRLNAGPRNPDGVGAVARLETGGRRGSAWPVLAGSGWWSQSSPELVIPRPPGGEEAFLTVRWADGRSTRVELPKGADAVEVDREGLRGQVDGAEKKDRP